MTESEKNQQQVEKTETKIKLLLLSILLLSIPRFKYIILLREIVNEFEDNFTLPNKSEYVSDIIEETEREVKRVIKPAKKKIDKLKVDPRFEVKGTPYIEYYDRVIKKALDGLDKWKLVTSEPGKRPITLWQKTELDTRHQTNMRMVEEAKKSGQDLWWLSAHINASGRCEPWQGKLVSLSMKPIKGEKFYTGHRKNGFKIYSFEAIENVVDKYGYKNNIINGFNCRHRLISFSEQDKPPRTRNKTIVKDEYKKNNYIRAMERKIRKMKQRYELIKSVDVKEAKRLKNQINAMTRHYEKYCIDNGFQVEKWRLVV